MTDSFRKTRTTRSTFSRNSTGSRFTFNGVEYDNVEEMPPDARRAFERVSGLLEDTDGDGIPDIVQNEGEKTVIHQATYTVNGVTYHSPDEMPEDVRRIYERMTGPIDADGDGIPDALQLGRHRPLSVSQASQPQQRQAAKSHAPRESRAGNLWMLLVLAGFLLSMVALIALIAWAIWQ